MDKRKDRKVRGLFHRPGSPQWWIRYADSNGRICRESTGTTEKKLARAILDKRKTQVAENRHLDVKKVSKTTFFELCTQYWENHGKHLRTKGLLDMIEGWKKGIGNPPLKDITTFQIERFLNERMEQGGIGPATRNRHLAMLRSLFNRAITWELMETNPTADIERLRETGARTRFLDQDEIQSLLAGASDRFRPILVTAIHTGIRRGEILHLEWPDVDIKNRLITIQQSKSGKKRMIPIDDTLMETLTGLPSRFQKGYVFPSRVKVGQPMVDLNHTFRRLVDRLEIENVRFHDLRHTFASHLVMNGVDIKTVQELLGHANITMTMRYSHLAPVHRARAVQILDTALQTDTKTDTVAEVAHAGSD